MSPPHMRTTTCYARLNPSYFSAIPFQLFTAPTASPAPFLSPAPTHCSRGTLTRSRAAAASRQREYIPGKGCQHHQIQQEKELGPPPVPAHTKKSRRQRVVFENKKQQKKVFRVICWKRGAKGE